MMRRNSFLLVLLLGIVVIGRGQEEGLDFKIDLYSLVTAQGLQLSVEKKVSKKWGIDASFYYYLRSRVYLSTRDPLTRLFLSEKFKSRRFSTTISALFYPSPMKEKGRNFFFGPTTRVEWITYIDPAYYIAARRSNFPNRNPFDQSPELDVGVIIGFKRKIFDNIIFEPSYSSTFQLGSFIRSRKKGMTFLSFYGWLSVRIAYRFKKGD